VHMDLIGTSMTTWSVPYCSYYFPDEHLGSGGRGRGRIATRKKTAQSCGKDLTLDEILTTALGTAQVLISEVVATMKNDQKSHSDANRVHM
jgi:hypothetical protein